MNIGERIKAARKSAGMTQSETAQAADIAINSLRLYESGKRYPNTKTLQQIANALDAPVEYFISDSQEENSDGISITTGERIRAARRKAGITQKALGEKLEMTQQQLAQYENGVRNPKYDTLQRISDALNVPIESISGYAKPDFKLSQEEERLLSAFNQLNTSGKAKALERIEEIAELK